jgi:hypothetical protein
MMPTPMPVPELTPVLNGAAEVVAWMKDNTTLIVGFALFAYIANRIIYAVGGKKKPGSSAATTVTTNADGSTTIEVQ